MRVVVLGGAGAMGRVCVKDLVWSGLDDVVVADRDLKAAEQVATEARRLAPDASASVTAIEADAAADSLGDLLSGADVVCNCVNYVLNTAVMRAAAAAGTNYLDLGGLFHGTRRQMALSLEIADSGILCLLGMGGTPGTMNVMAALGAERLDTVDTIHLRCGGTDPEPGSSPLPAPYAIDTILDEFTMTAMALRRGRLVELPPASQDEDFDFPEPVGRQTALATLHSELATMPQTFGGLGLSEADFKVAFEPGMIERYRFVASLGLAETSPLTFPGGGEVVPRAVLKALAGPQTFSGKDVESLVVELHGTKDSRPSHIRVEELAYPSDVLGTGGADANTGVPPSIAAQMIATGVITGTGIRAPEEVVPPSDYATELGRRDITVTVHELHDLDPVAASGKEERA